MFDNLNPYFVIPVMLFLGMLYCLWNYTNGQVILATERMKIKALQKAKTQQKRRMAFRRARRLP